MGDTGGACQIIRRVLDHASCVDFFSFFLFPSRRNGRNGSEGWKRKADNGTGHRCGVGLWGYTRLYGSNVKLDGCCHHFRNFSCSKVEFDLYRPWLRGAIEIRIEKLHKTYEVVLTMQSHPMLLSQGVWLHLFSCKLRFWLRHSGKGQGSRNVRWDLSKTLTIFR